MINDVWRASDPDAPVHQGDTWRDKDAPLLFGAWWLLWVVLNFAYNADLRLSVRAESLDDLQFSSGFTTLTDSLSVATGLFALAVVHRTTARHEARADWIALSGGVSLPRP